MSVLAIGVGWAETVFYTLDGSIIGGNNGYATVSDITQDGMSWKVTGNTQMSPWRIGGKSLTEVDRDAYSTTAMGSSISKIELKVGQITCTLNSVKLTVASDASFSNILDQITKSSVSANSTLEFTPSSGTDWAKNAYYKFTFNVTCGSSSNFYVQLTKATFYNNPPSDIATPVISGTTPFEGSTQVTITCATTGASIYYTTDGNEPTASSLLYNAPFTITQTTTVKAIAELNGQTSNIATKSFTATPIITTIAEFNNLAVNDNFKYTGNNLVYIKSNPGGNNHYVQDGLKGMLIYGSLGQTYQPGDVIPGGFTGTRAEYNGAPEMTNPAGFTASSQNVGLTPLEITYSDVTIDNFGRYVVIKNAAIDGSNLVVDGQNVPFHNSLGATLPTNTEGKLFNVKGVVGAYNGNAQILPIEFTDVTPVTGPEYYLVGSFNENDGVWVQQDPDYKFTKRADGSYILNNVELAEGVEFKIIKVDGGATTWYGGTVTDGGSNYGVNGNVHNNLPLDNTDNGKNFKLEVAGTNDFVISSDMKLTVNRDAALYMKGSYSNDDWVTKTPLTATNDGWTVTMDMATDTQFGFVDEWNTWHGGNGYWIKAEHMGTEIPIVSDGNFIMKVESNFTFNVNSALTTLVVTDNNAAAEGAYVKVTSADDLTSGTYLIVYEDGNLAFNGGLETLDAVGNSIAVTIGNNTIPSSTEVDAAVFTYDADAGTFMSASGKYIGQTSDANGLASSATTAYSNTVTIDADGNADIVSSGGAYLRYNAASNQTRFRYYKSASYTAQKAIQLYKKSGQNLGAPVIEGETPFMETTTVTITAEDGAAIYYTTNGDTPSSASTLYQAPFQLTETATVKAIAVKNEASSAVATKTFVKTPQLASATEFYSYEGTDEFVFTGNLVAIAQTGKYLYAQDNAKGVLIFGTIDQTYNKGDKIPAGFHAKKGVYHGAPQMADPTSMQGATEQATIEPVELTVDQITLDNYARYAIIKNVKYENGNYTVGDATLTIYDRFGLEFTPEEGKTYDIVGVSGWYDGAQFMPLEFKEVRETYEVRWGQGDPWEQENIIAMYLDVITGKWSVADQEMPAGSEFKIVKKRDNGDGNPTLTWLGAIADGTYWITADNLGTEITLGSTDAHKNLFFEDAGNYTFTFDPSNSTLVVTATEYYYRVENEGNCTVTDLGNGSATIGQTVTVRVLPDSGYKFKEASITRDASNNPDIEETPIGYTITPVEGSSNQVDLSFVMPGSDVQINVFCDVVYPISINVGPGGMATTDKAEASEGETVTVTVTPSNDYRLDEITYSYTIDGNATTTQPQFIANGQYSFTMPAAAVAINVTFKKFNNQVKFDANPVGGTVVVKANDNAISSMDYVVEGTAMVVEANPAEGYELKSLMVYEGILDEGADLDQAEEIACTLQDGKYLFTMPTSNVTIIAEFTQILYDLEGVAFDIDRDWATYFNSARNLALPEDIQAYVVTGVTNDAVEITEINYIPAGVGVLLHSTEIINEITTTLYTGETGTHTSMLVGSDEAQNITEGYVLYNNAFYSSESGIVAAHRCYLPATQVAGAPRILKIGASDVPTAIESIIAQGNVAGINYVNLSGMTSSEPWRGVNIAVITFTDGTTRTVKVIK